MPIETWVEHIALRRTDTLSQQLSEQHKGTLLFQTPREHIPGLIRALGHLGRDASLMAPDLERLILRYAEDQKVLVATTSLGFG